MSRIEFNPLSDVMGAEILGVDLRRPLSDSQKAEILHLFDEHLVLIFRDQHISSEDQVRAVELFGVPVQSEYGDDRAESYFTKDLFAEGLPFHQDFEFSPWPIQVQSLYAIDIDIPCVPTIWANCLHPAERMSLDRRACRSRPSAVHSMDKQASKPSEGGAATDPGSPDISLTQSLKRMREAVLYPETSYPVITMHPRTGMPLLYVTEGYTSHIEGMEQTESTALLNELFGLLYAGDNLFTHDWRKWDLAIWDGQATQHGRPALVPGAKRTFRRVLAAERNPKETMGEAFTRPGMPAYD